MGNFSAYLELQYHQKLNPKIWQDDKSLLPGIEDHILKVAYAWAEFARIPKDAILDVTLTGSSANYNWSPASDLDIHLIVDPTLSPIADAEILHDYVLSKKDLWSVKHTITIAGMPVEVYAQLIGEPFNAGGVYSISLSDWVKKPEQLKLNFSRRLDIQSTVKEYMKKINSLTSLEDAKELKLEINSLRKEALLTGNEFSFGNLVYKALRNTGYIVKLINFILHLEDQDFSLSFSS